MADEASVTGFGQDSFVIVWPEGGEVRGAIYNAFGQAAGASFVVNTTTAGAQQAPDVARLANGGFVVVWRDDSATGGDTSGTAVRAQRFDSAGAKAGGEILVNTTVAGDQVGAVVAASGTGFVVAWRDKSNAGGNADDIRAQRFDAAGAKLGLEMLIDGSAQNQAEVTVTDRSGGFVVAWETQADLSGTVQQAKVQAYAENGATVGTEFVRNAGGEGLNEPLELARIDAAGNYALLYQTQAPQHRVQTFTNAGVADSDYLVVADTTVGTFVQGVHLAPWNTVTGETAAAGWGVRTGVNGSLQVGNISLTGFGEQSTVRSVSTGNQPHGLDAAMLQDGRVVVVTLDGANGTSFTIADGRGPNFGVVTAAGASTLVGADTGSPDVHNVITGSAQIETMYGLGGNDYLYGYGGGDMLIAGLGIDVLLGDTGNDTLYGEGDQDYLFGGTGSNVLVGGDGVDVLNSEAGSVNDVLYGGDGGDYIYAYGTTSTFAYGEGGNDIFVMQNGPAFGYGGEGQDYFYMGAFADSMQGDAGVDVLIGGGGNDTYKGGAGTDYLFLDAGSDQVVHDMQSGVDVVNSFNVTQDLVRLQGTTLTSFAQVQAATTNYDSFIVITMDANTAIWLVGVKPEQLTQSNFVFS
jgi:Ca2+-binding RTX toxin-like protein